MVFSRKEPPWKFLMAGEPGPYLLGMGFTYFFQACEGQGPMSGGEDGGVDDFVNRSGYPAGFQHLGIFQVEIFEMQDDQDCPLFHIVGV